MHKSYLDEWMDGWMDEARLTDCDDCCANISTQKKENENLSLHFSILFPTLFFTFFLCVELLGETMKITNQTPAVRRIDEKKATVPNSGRFSALYLNFPSLRWTLPLKLNFS